MNYKITIQNKIKDIMLYISAFVPMYFLILLKLVIERICGNLDFNALFVVYLVSLLAFIIIGITGLIINNQRKILLTGIFLVTFLFLYSLPCNLTCHL